MVLRSGLELSKSTSKEGQEEYEHIKSIQYNSSSGKKSKRSSRKTSKECTPVGGEKLLHDYFEGSSQFNISKDESKSSANKSIASVQKMLDQATQELEIKYLNVELNDFLKTTNQTVQTEEADVNMTNDVSNEEAPITETSHIEASTVSDGTKRIQKLVNCILIEGQVIWELEWDDLTSDDKNVSYEYERVLVET